MTESLTAPWRDRRAEARAQAREELERTRKRELFRAAHIARVDARERGNTTYTGSPCPYHPTNYTRFLSSGHCVICSRERADLRRRRNGTYGMNGRRKPRAPGRLP